MCVDWVAGRERITKPLLQVCIGCGDTLAGSHLLVSFATQLKTPVCKLFARVPDAATTTDTRVRHRTPSQPTQLHMRTNTHLTPTHARPHQQARFAQWPALLTALSPSDLDYSSDGIMVPPAAGVFGQGVYHYVRALAYASAAAHAPTGACVESTRLSLCGMVCIRGLMLGRSKRASHCIN